eukprot:CAMPEP_0185768778 /NCGR_PEP_ID=MMETSP1174-20130828/52118_1 /TAXON_ID=35687 /ORGANISM="Dictyocha speculum, Strain CCMP1381" /LENGTH=53 /DNA_ID=CAMNT_0028453631 /DNA_START=66 /DNA_END=227 /DNA_ORIENTATION=+
MSSRSRWNASRFLRSMPAERDELSPMSVSCAALCFSRASSSSLSEIWFSLMRS